MATENLTKKELIIKFQEHKTDTGSTEVQIALLTERINSLVEHLKINRKDHYSRRGLLILVNRRKRLQRYYLKEDKEKYLKLIKELNIKK